MKGSESGDSVWLLRGAVIAVALLAALVSWLATRDDEDGSAQAESQSRIVTEAELSEAAKTLGQPVFWAGPIEATELELEELGEGGVRVRYLPEGEEETTEALTIGSYPQEDPAGALEGFGRRPGSIVREAKGGTKLYSSEEAPTSVYFADPTGAVQVEVYSPSPEEAMDLALSGDVVPVE